MSKENENLAEPTLAADIPCAMKLNKIEELAETILSVVEENSHTPEGRRHALRVIGYIVKGEIDDVLKLAHNIRVTSLPGEMAGRIYDMEMSHGIYTMKKYIME